MSTLPLPDGYEEIQDLGPDALGRVVTARETESSQTRRIRCVAYPSPEQAEGAAQRAQALIECTHENLLSPLSVHTVDSSLVCVQPGVHDMTNLAQLLQERRAFNVHEVFFVLQRVGAGLISAHEAGVVHGALTPGCVHLSADGSVVLSDVGIASLHPDLDSMSLSLQKYQDSHISTHAGLTPSTDTRGVALLAAHMLIGEPPLSAQHWAESAYQQLDQAVIRCFVEALMPPESRPSLSRMLEEFSAAVGEPPAPQQPQQPESPPPPPPEPVVSEAPGEPLAESVPQPQKPAEENIEAPTLVEPVAPASEKRKRQRKKPPMHTAAQPRGARRWMVWAAVAASVVVLVGGGVGWWFFQLQPATTQETSGETPSQVRETSPVAQKTEKIEETQASTPPEQWEKVLVNLDALRSQAFDKADATKLSKVYTGDSELLSVDAQQIQTLKDDNVTMSGVRHRMEVQKVVRGGGETGEVTLKVRDGLEAYTVHNADGNVVREVPAAELRTLYITLLHTDAGWRIDAVKSSA